MAPAQNSKAKPIAALIGKAIDPVIRKRGLARADLISWWPDIVGPGYAGATVPDRIRWPKDGSPAVLFIRCDPALALPLEYEREAVRQRLNGFLGFPAVGEVRILQYPVNGASKKNKAQPEPDPQKMRALSDRLGDLDRPLRDSLMALGRNIIARS